MAAVDGDLFCGSCNTLIVDREDFLIYDEITDTIIVQFYLNCKRLGINENTIVGGPDHHMGFNVSCKKCLNNAGIYYTYYDTTIKIEKDVCCIKLKKSANFKSLTRVELFNPNVNRLPITPNESELFKRLCPWEDNKSVKIFEWIKFKDLSLQYNNLKSSEENDFYKILNDGLYCAIQEIIREPSESQIININELCDFLVIKPSFHGNKLTLSIRLSPVNSLFHLMGQALPDNDQICHILSLKVKEYLKRIPSDLIFHMTIFISIEGIENPKLILKSQHWNLKSNKEYTTIYTPPMALLNNAINSKSLVDLHTHLKGMGDYNFWINRIICLYLPNKLQKYANLDIESTITKINSEYHSFNYEIISSLDSIDTKSFISTYNVKPIHVTYQDNVFRLIYTPDVVYDKKTIGQGFELDFDCPFFEGKLETYFQGLKSPYKWSEIYRPYIIMSPSKDRFELVQGIANQHIAALLETINTFDHTIPLLAKLKNCFSMLNEDGTHPNRVTINSYENNFTPKFYPQRFAFKDCILKQKPDVYSVLLDHVLSRYEDAGIGYVEFSLSISCVMNVHCWKHLIDNVYNMDAEWRLYYPFSRKRAINVNYKFMGAFNRFEFASIEEMQDIYYTTDKEYWPMYMYSKIYNGKFKLALDTLRSKNENLNNYLRLYYCGIDLVGDELYNPTIHIARINPAILVEFVKLSKELNPKFGIRLHAAENVPFKHLEYFKLHMTVLYEDIHRLLEILNVENNLNVKMRIGHGVSIFNESHDKEVTNLLNCFKKMLKTNSIPCELNMTSNIYLLPGNMDRSSQQKGLRVVREMISSDVPVILSTDDDGIWILDNCSRHGYHTSTAHEFCHLISNSDITVDDIQNMLENSKFAFN